MNYASDRTDNWFGTVTQICILQESAARETSEVLKLAAPLPLATFEAVLPQNTKSRPKRHKKQVKLNGKTRSVDVLAGIGRCSAPPPSATTVFVSATLGLAFTCTRSMS